MKSVWSYTSLSSTLADIGQERKKLAYDGVAWFLNVGTSVVIVFVNKLLMDPIQGYGFKFATTLCAMHFLSATVAMTIAQALGYSQRAALPLDVIAYFACVANVSIASLNLSLLENSVGFYQIAKLLIIPFVCVVELVWLRRQFTARVVLSVTTVVLGVGIVTVSDVSVNLKGLVIAAVSVVSSGLQQILVGTIQRKYKLQSHQLLANTAPMQGLMLLAIGPFIDQSLTGGLVTEYRFTPHGMVVLLASCSVSVLVNISQFMCLGRFSAVTFQVLGHTKTVLVLLTSWLALGERMTGRKLLGMVLAVAGMVSYGYHNSKTQPAPPDHAAAAATTAGGGRQAAAAATPLLPTAARSRSRTDTDGGRP